MALLVLTDDYYYALGIGEVATQIILIDSHSFNLSDLQECFHNYNGNDFIILKFTFSANIRVIWKALKELTCACTLLSVSLKLSNAILRINGDFFYLQIQP